MPTISTGQNRLTVFYRLHFENGETYIMMVSPIDAEVGRVVIGNVTEDYTVVGTLLPVSRLWTFLRGVLIPQQYIQDMMALDERTASLLYVLMPILTTIPPADDLLDLATTWYESHLI